MNWRERAVFAYAKQEQHIARVEAARREERRADIERRLQDICGTKIPVSLRDDGTTVAHPDLLLWLTDGKDVMAARVCPHCGYQTGSRWIHGLHDIGALYVIFRQCINCLTPLTFFDIDSISDEELEAATNAS